MRLVEGSDWRDLMAAVRAMAAKIAPFDLPPLAVQDLHGFLALRETEASAAAAGAGRCLRRPTSTRFAPRRQKKNWPAAGTPG